MKRLWRRVAFVPPAVMMTATLLFGVSSFVRALETSVARDETPTTRTELSERIDAGVESASATSTAQGAVRFEVAVDVESDSETFDEDQRPPRGSRAPGRATFVF